MKTALMLCVVALASVAKPEREPMPPSERYKNSSETKRNGAIFTPLPMARALAIEMLDAHKGTLPERISVLDPAAGEGELLVGFVEQARARRHGIAVRIVGYEINAASCKVARERLAAKFPDAEVEIRNGDFLEQVCGMAERFDFVIANPPYIRTQILGAKAARELAKKYGLSGRVDIYYAFLVNTSRVLADGGVAGYITSNKFFSIKSGAGVRRFMMENCEIVSLTDYGDTKVFANAAVLPCTIVFKKGKTEDCNAVRFASIYERADDGTAQCCRDVFEHLSDEGLYKVPDGRTFLFRQGVLNECAPGDVWTLSSNATRDWMRRVNANTELHFSDLGKIRVGIKTTADNVFIGDDWGEGDERPELLKPLVTHRDAGKITAGTNCNWCVLYPHRSVGGKRMVVDIDDYPKSKQYLERHKAQLAGRKYVAEAGRKWYEIWVPQNPEAWEHRKIVFRDISESPQFWYDNSGAVVNGDCYWIDIDSSVPDNLVYLALAVANSSFIEKYYDVCFNTKLYSGKRRFMTQFVEQFPLPSTNSVSSARAVALIKAILENSGHATHDEMETLDGLVNEMFLSR